MSWWKVALFTLVFLGVGWAFQTPTYACTSNAECGHACSNLAQCGGSCPGFGYCISDDWCNPVTQNCEAISFRCWTVADGACAYCSCSQPPSPTPTFAPPPQNVPSCSFTGTPPVSVVPNTPATYNVACSDVDLNLVQIGILWSGTSTDVWYSGTDCTFSARGSETCSRTFSWPTAGTYYVTINGYDSTGWGGRCSGNPWCEWPPSNPPTTKYQCTTSYGYYDCSTNDVVTVTVANPTPTPMTAPSCSVSSISVSPSTLTVGGSSGILTFFIGGQYTSVGVDSWPAGRVSISAPVAVAPGTYRSVVTPLIAGSVSVLAIGYRNGIPLCNANTSVIVANPTPTPTLAATVSGGVYDDPNAGGPGPQCTGSLTTGVRPAATSLVRVTPPAGSLTGAVQTSGAYSVGPVAPGTMSLTLENLGSYQCICPSGCRYASQSITSANQSGWNFFVSALKPVWWKAVGGHVHSQGNLTSNVPNLQYLIDNASGGYPGVLTRGASVNLGTQGGTFSSQSSWNFNEIFASTSWRYGYDVLYARAGRPTTDPGNGSSPPAIGVFYENGAYTMSGGTWTGLSGSRVIFVNGDVTINTSISLANSSAFLAIIAKGNISVASTVGNISRPMNPTSTDASLTGVFLADGNFRGGTNGTGGTTPDLQLVIYGTVGADMDLNGTGNVDGQRNMGVNPGPGVAYVWNPNLMVNAPSELFESLTDWREAAP